MDEKTENGGEKRQVVRRGLQTAFFVILAAYMLFKGCSKANFGQVDTTIEIDTVSLCPQPETVEIVEHDRVQYILHDAEYRNVSAALLSGAVKIDTTIYDDTTDFTKWDQFHRYLQEKFPLVHKYAKLHKVNGYGLLFEFVGADHDKKPVVFMAHQDTVPIGDSSDWVRDPWSGEYDGDKVYGRGVSDCKNLLVGLMEAVELLLKDGKTDFERRFFLSFGYDEEVGGPRGAKSLAGYLVDYLGENSVEYITDEGPMMFSESDGAYYGYIMTGEKGYMDLFVTVDTPGGHSSMPRDHTSIGILSTYLHSYERNLYEPRFVEDTPWKGCLNCMAAHGNLPTELKSLVEGATTSPRVQRELLSYLSDLHEWRYSVRTSQAIDIVSGGDKANSLPRNARAVVNHRIAYGDSVNSVKDKARDVGWATAHQYGLGFSAFGEDLIPVTEEGLLNLTTADTAMDPVRASQPKGPQWDFFAGSIRSFYEQEVFPDKLADTKLIVTPAMFPGNTDMRHYLKLSPNLFRSQPGSVPASEMTAHDHDEWMSMDSHLEVVGFYYNHIATVCL